MELLVDRNDRDSVFTFEDGLVDKVWESEPVTRFQFLNPVKNDLLLQQLSANRPTAGIVFDGSPYIGTNDGLIYAPERKIQRIPNIHVDTELFLKNFPFTSDLEREQFQEFKESHFKLLQASSTEVVERMFDINDKYNVVSRQERNIGNYLTGGLAIRGFGVNYLQEESSPTLYDGSLLGITETLTGRVINPLPVHAIEQINPDVAGVVPAGAPPIKQTRVVIEEGIEQEVDVHCVDYRSLWKLNGQSMFVQGICPRDGSGYAHAIFATDGETIAVSHGNHPCYVLDIYKEERVRREQIKSISLNPHKTPRRIIVSEGRVIGDYGNTIRDFSREEDVFSPEKGKITSLSDSALCTVKHDDRTDVYHTITKERLTSLDGDFVFLLSTPQ